MEAETVKETSEVIKVRSHRASKSKLGDEDGTNLFNVEDMFCGIDKHRCDGPCRKANTEQFGVLLCSEVISRRSIRSKKRRKKRLFSDRRDREDNSRETY